MRKFMMAAALVAVAACGGNDAAQDPEQSTPEPAPVQVQVNPDSTTPPAPTDSNTVPPAPTTQQ